ncbi:LysR substrate-binding domain-containing protein [Lichenicoccus sp.]|uniref:LysR substrate-binding domain-containing protein n=1 Tax=Lichenicoccus sp. TaxID=2781899 RepID=UPI003D0F533F
MTLEQLRIFVAVAERQHVTRAAEALLLTQSAVSSAIHALEHDFAVKLFNRVGRGIELSEAGRLFLDEARAVLARTDLARLRMAELGGLRRGTLRLHASQTIASYWLPRHLMAFRGTHPRVELELRVGNTTDVVRAVREGTAEIGLIEGTIDHPGLVARDVARDQLIVVVAPGHPWAERSGDLAASDLPGSAWVMREAGSGTRSEFETAIAAAGLDPAALTITLELPSNEAVRAAVEAGGAATAISASVAAPAIEAGLLVAVPFSLPSRAFRSLLHAERTPSRSAEAFLAAIAPPRPHQ